MAATAYKVGKSTNEIQQCLTANHKAGQSVSISHAGAYTYIVLFM